MKAADELAKHVGVKPACAALEVSRSTLYRRRGPSTGHQQPRPTPARALSETERGEVFDTLCSERFVDRSPAEVVATLLDEEVYLCSERTMYRVLASEVPVQERRAQRTHPEYKKPELMATAPNQVWSWDITRLLGPKKWSYYYLYVIMDIYSRYVVGWMVADRENSALAGRLIQQSCLKHGVHSGVRRKTRRVTNWKNGAMALRWAAASFVETEKSYRRIIGYDQLWMLRAHLDDHEPVAEMRKAR